LSSSAAAAKQTHKNGRLCINARLGRANGVCASALYHPEQSGRPAVVYGGRATADALILSEYAPIGQAKLEQRRG